MGIVNWIWDALCCRRKSPYNPDVPCGWIYAIGVALMVLFTILATTVWNGDIRRLTHGFDYEGNLCGVDSEVKNKKYLYWCAEEPFNTAVGDAYPNTICHDCRICLDHCPGGNALQLMCPTRNVNNFVLTGPNGTTSGTGIQVAERLDMIVVQKTAVQPSYPTESWGGHYCLPKENENNIRHEIQDGPYGGRARFGAGLGSLENGWLVFLIMGVIGLVMGLLFICAISHFAGVVLFGTMMCSLFIVLIFAIFFLGAIFVFEEDQSSWYQGANPLYDSVDFEAARGWSALIGLTLLLITAFLLLFTCRSVKRIDETMGMVSAATDAINQNWCLYIVPCITCVMFFVAVGLMLAGLLVCYTIGEIEPRILVNKKRIQGLENALDSPWYMYLIVALFAIMIWWTIETIFAITQLMTSAVMWDFFLATDTKTIKSKPQTGPFNRNRTTMMRASGVDRNQDPRMASIGTTPGGQVMVAPVGQGMPGFRDQVPDGNFNVTYQPPDREVKNISMGKQGKAAFDSLWLFPSACWGALWVGATRIPRWIAHFIGVEFVYEPSLRKKENYSDPNQSARKTKMWNGCGRCFMWLENILGLYNGNSFTELLMFYGDPAGGKKDAGVREVTKKYGFLDASRAAMDDMNEAHGAVSFLRGSLTLYEVMASFLAFWISLGIAALLFEYVWWWNDEDSDWYVDDTALAVFVAGLIGGIATFLVMTMLTQVADAFLYIFNYYRMRGYGGAGKYLKGTQLGPLVGHEKDAMPGDILKDKKHRQRAANLLLHEEGEGNEALPLLSTAINTHGGH